MELLETKEIKELIENIKDLNSLIVNFDRKKLEDLLLKLQTKYQENTNLTNKQQNMPKTSKIR